MITRFPGTQCSSYFDDFFAVGPESISRDMLAACLRFCRLIGTIMKDSKSEYGRALEYLGVGMAASVQSLEGANLFVSVGRTTAAHHAGRTGGRPGGLRDRQPLKPRETHPAK